MKNRRSLRKAIAWISLAAILLTGCSKAPRADITAKSNTERLEEAAAVTLAYTPVSQSAQEEAASAPAQTVGTGGLRYDEVAIPTSPLYDLLGASTRYSVDLEPTSDVVKIVVDADVYLPDTDKLPTLRVAPRDFTQDEVTRLFNALCGDTVMYKARQEMTRAEVEERIADVETEMQTATDPDRIKKLESNLAYWQNELKTAPETVPVEISDGTLEERQLGIQEYLGKYMALDAYEHQENYYTYSGKSFHVHGDTYDKNKKSGYDFPVGANVWYTRDQSFGKYLNYNLRQWIVDESTVPAEAVGLSMIPAEARQLVETFWMDSGFEDMVVSGVYLVCDSPHDDYASTGDDPYVGCHAYVVTCGQSINGVMPPPANNGDPHWGFESCSFTITDNGIENFNWYSPYAYGDVTTENSALLTFDKIDEIFRKMMLVKYDLTGGSNGLTSATYRIDRVALEMSRVTDRKSSEKGLLVPVWNFYGTYYFTYEDGHNFGSDDREGFPSPLLRINAVDGSIIEPRYGC
ncbi:MAG: hypothetical protein IKE11_00680 [Clostridia bacterium]|nr:hypothetical protein [Clostridia bacterium]